MTEETPQGEAELIERVAERVLEKLAPMLENVGRAAGRTSSDAGSVLQEGPTFLLLRDLQRNFRLFHESQSVVLKQLGRLQRDATEIKFDLDTMDKTLINRHQEIISILM